MPVLTIWGEHDRMVPRAHGEAYAQGLPGARDLMLIAGAGHAAPLEQSEATADAVVSFLREQREKQKREASAQ